MANALTLNTIDNEPRMLDTDLAEALGFERPRKIRELIATNMDELSSMGSLAPEQGKSRVRSSPPTTSTKSRPSWSVCSPAPRTLKPSVSR